MPNATAFCNSFKSELLAMTPHAAADVYRIALYTSASNMGAATTVYSATSEVVGTGYTAGGVNLVGFTVAVDGSTAVLDWATDPTWTNATITARGALIYNSSKGNRAVASYDFGSDVSSTGATFTAQLPAPTAAAGLVRIG